MEIICKRCNDGLTNENWYSSLRKANHKMCINCWGKYCNERNRKRYGDDIIYKKYKNDISKKRNAKYRIIALEYYSKGKLICECCGENHIEFLSIDHLNGCGRKHRKEVNISNICNWLVKNNFPKGFRVLCYNCNLSIGFNKYCPHEGDENH